MTVSSEREYEFQWTVPAEQELALRDPAEVDCRLRAIATDLDAECTDSVTDRFTDRFLDTKHWTLLRGGVGLRHRRRGEDEQLTLKRVRAKARVQNGLSRHDEWHLRWEKALPERASDLPTLLREILEPYVRGRRLRRMLDVSTRRWQTELTLPGGERALLLVDAVSTEAAPGSGDSLKRPDSEGWPRAIDLPLRVELEFQSGSAPPTDEALGFAEAFADRSGLIGARHNKLVTAIAALRPDAKTATRRTEEHALSALDVVADQLRSGLHDLHRAESRVREKSSRGRVRRFRVACRRLRAALRLHAELQPEGPGQPLQKGLRRAARTFGELRDLDVLCRRLELLDDQIPVSLRESSTRTRAQWLAQRGSLTDHALTQLRGKKVQSAFRRLDRFVETLPRELGGAPLDATVTELFDRQIVRVLARQDLALSTGELDALHDVRLGVKRLRDMTRLFSKELDLRAAEMRLKILQDQFGELQDCACTIEQLEILRRDPTLSREQIAVLGAWLTLEHNRSERAREHCLERLESLGSGFWNGIRPTTRACGTPLAP